MLLLIMLNGLQSKNFTRVTRRLAEGAPVEMEMVEPPLQVTQLHSPVSELGSRLIAVGSV